MLAVGTKEYPGMGQIDLSSFSILASGIPPAIGLDALFHTDGDGEMNLSARVPLALVGVPIAFQAAVVDPDTTLALTNAVQVYFLP